MYFCVRNYMSPSNDYTAVACSNNNQAVIHSGISSLLISRRLAKPRVAWRYSVQTSSVTGSGRGNQKLHFARQ